MTGLGAFPAMVVLATAGARLVAVPAAPSSGCPSAAQVADALRTRLPDATVPAESRLWPDGREVLRSVLDIAPDGTLVRFALVGARGDVQLRRSLPTAVHGEADECIALAEALAAIVERFIDFPDYDAQSDPSPLGEGLGAAAPGLGAGAPAGRTPSAAPWRPMVLVHVGGGVQTTGSGSTYDGHLGVEVGVLRWRHPLALTASVGIGSQQQGTQPVPWTLRRFPFRLGASTWFDAGPGVIEPIVEVGVEPLRGTKTELAAPDILTTSTKPFTPDWSLNGAVGYRLPLGSHLFLRLRGGAGVAWAGQIHPALGSPVVLVSTPPAYLEAALETGMLFR